MKTAAQVLRHGLDRAELLRALRLLKSGDYSVRMPGDLGGIGGEIARAFNDVAAVSAALAEAQARESADRKSGG
jgi:hypothetical protein